jgi:predicted Zn-dependent protease
MHRVLTPVVDADEIVSKKSIEEAIAWRQNKIETLKEFLPYADGQAYYQDKEKIRKLSIELDELHEHLANIEE